MRQGCCNLTSVKKPIIGATEEGIYYSETIYMVSREDDVNNGRVNYEQDQINISSIVNLFYFILSIGDEKKEDFIFHLNVLIPLTYCFQDHRLRVT